MANPIASRVKDLLIMAWDPDWKESGLLYCFDCLTQGEGIVVWKRLKPSNIPAIQVSYARTAGCGELVYYGGGTCLQGS